MRLPPTRHKELIGRAGSRYQLSTPTLVIDLDRMESNLKCMRSFCDQAGIGLRPHAKAHKSITIAEKQMAQGAMGICCATLGEAEIIAGAGIRGVLITSPVVGDQKIARLAALNASCHELMVVADNADNITALDAAAENSRRSLGVLVDLDIGQRRTGAISINDVIELVEQIHRAPGLEFLGIQAYAGHLQHLGNHSARSTAASQSAQRLRTVLDALNDRNIRARIVTGAGTGTYDIDPALGVFTEMQTGSYLFMDVDYSNPTLWQANGPPFANALFVQTTVISVNHPGQATTDGGLKAFATDGPSPTIANGAPVGSSYKFTGDEFGCVTLPSGERLSLGAVVECVVPHCDPTVNLYDFYHCVRGNVLVDIWSIDARGKY